jgi:hypothetical protein
MSEIGNRDQHHHIIRDSIIEAFLFSVMKGTFDADIALEYPQLKDDKIIYFDTAGRSVLPASVEKGGHEALKYYYILKPI